ncbi:MAG: hypothetical protein WCH46_02330 [bacterium]
MTRKAAFTTLVFALLLFFGARLSATDSTSTQTVKTLKALKVKATKKKPLDSLKVNLKVASKKKSKNKKAVIAAPKTLLHPTFSGAAGTVKNYFFPTRIGAEWTLRTIQRLIDTSNHIVREDTIYGHSVVRDTAKYSLQGLPLLITADSSYRSTGTGVTFESSYYVDDSIAMTVFNNSVTHGENRIFLVSPLQIRTAWHENSTDTIVTMIAGIGDSLLTPIGKFEHVLITLTQTQYSDMRKYFAPGRGIVKTVYRTIGPGGLGLVIVTCEMIAFKKPD